jgi:hypothetical protein
MKNRTMVVAAAASAAALGAASPLEARGETFGASNVTASSFFAGDDRAPIHTIDQSGLNGSGEHSNAIGVVPGVMWLSDNEPSPTITWDFGKNYTLDGFHLWNYNEVAGALTYTLRGVRTADVLISDDPAFGTFTNLGTQTFAQATGQPNYTGEDYTVPTASGRYLRFTNTASFPGADTYTGLSEINFQGTLTPVPLLTPVGATASSFFAPDDRNPAHTIDGSGFAPGTADHSNAPGGNMWLATPDDPNPTITWDLGSSQPLEGIRLWNYNENSGNPNLFLKRGVNTARVQVSDDPNFATFTDLGVMTFQQASGGNLYSGTDYDIALTSGRFVRFTDILSFDELDADDFVGISEIRFITVPEPAALSTLALAGLGLLARRRRRA